MRSLKVLSIAALAALLPLQVLAADAVPSATFTGKLAANQPLATAAGTKVTGVSGWIVRRDGDLTVFEAPENDTRIAVVDLKAADARAAISAAWARLGGPNAKREPKVVAPLPARTGWDERIVADYDIPPDDKMYAQAVALRRGADWTVFIIDGAVGTLGKRSAALSLMRSSLTPAGYKPENFAGRKPHALDAARLAMLREFLEQGMQDLGVPGVGYAVLDGGKIVAEGGLGVRELGKRTPVDANTLFMAASNTKGMSTLLLATLADEGKLRWDQPVSQLYPTFKLGNAETTSRVLVKHLVCACTGLPRQDLEWLFDYKKVDARGSMALLGTNSPTSGFGELFQYNNLMASAAGYIGAHLIHPKMELGKAYDKAMQDRIFKPLGMHATTFDSARAMRGNFAAPHVMGYDNRPMKIDFEMNNSVLPHRPAGGVWTSAHDFARYVQMEAAAGKLPNGKQLVSAENLLKRREAQVATGQDKAYGMGLSTERTAGIDVVLHGGSLFGYQSNFYLVPETGAGVVLLTNSDEGAMLTRPFLRRLLEVMYDGAPEAAADVKASAARRASARTAASTLFTVPPDAAMTGKLAGHYRNKLLGDLHIRQRGKDMMIDAGEWSVPFGSRNGSGKPTLVSSAPHMDFELVVGEQEGKRTLVLHDAQHEYTFVEVN